MVKDMANHFARVCDDTLAEYGVKNGQVIYLAGSVFVPEEKDQFNYRMKFLGAFVNDKHITVTDDIKMFYIDPASFTLMNAGEEAELIAIRDAEFAPPKQDIMADEKLG